MTSVAAPPGTPLKGSRPIPSPRLCVLALCSLTAIVGTLLPWTAFGFGSTTVTLNAFSQPPATGYGYAIGAGLVDAVAVVTFSLALFGILAPRRSRQLVWLSILLGVIGSVVLANRWWCLVGQAEHGRNEPYATLLSLQLGPWVCALGLAGVFVSAVACLRVERRSRGDEVDRRSALGGCALLTGASVVIVGTLLPWTGAAPTTTALSAYDQPFPGNDYSIGAYVLVAGSVFLLATATILICAGARSRKLAIAALAVALAQLVVLVDRVWLLELQVHSESSPADIGFLTARYGSWVCGAGAALSITAAWRLVRPLADAGVHPTPAIAPATRTPTIVTLLVGCVVAFGGEFLDWSSFGWGDVYYHVRPQFWDYNGFQQSVTSGNTYALGSYLAAACIVGIAVLTILSLRRPRASPKLALGLVVLSGGAVALIGERLWYLWNLGDRTGYRPDVMKIEPWIAVSAAGATACLLASFFNWRPPRRRGTTDSRVRAAVRSWLRHDAARPQVPDGVVVRH